MWKVFSIVLNVLFSDALFVYHHSFSPDSQSQEKGDVTPTTPRQTGVVATLDVKLPRTMVGQVLRLYTPLFRVRSLHVRGEPGLPFPQNIGHSAFGKGRERVTRDRR